MTDTVNELMHYGIMGMKWGVRRYQNPDGSLTETGKKRYSNGLSKRWGIRKKYSVQYNPKYYSKVYKAAKLKEKADKINDRKLKTLSKAEKYTRRSEKAHAKYDLKSANKAAAKSARYALKATKQYRKAAKYSAGSRDNLRAMNKASKYNMKSTKYKVYANEIAKQTGYGRKAMKLSVKSDKLRAKAAKYEYRCSKYANKISNIKVSAATESPYVTVGRYYLARLDED